VNQIQREARVTTRRVRDGGPGADAQWWLVSGESNPLDAETDLRAQAGVQSMGRGLWAVWGFNPETRSSFLDSTHPSRETALVAARAAVLAKVLPEHHHPGDCPAGSPDDTGYDQFVPACSNCDRSVPFSGVFNRPKALPATEPVEPSFCQCFRPNRWFPTDRDCTRGCGLPIR
jgi:hypothetical protein